MARFTRYLIVLILAFAVAAAAAQKKAVPPKEFSKGGPFSPGILMGDTLYVSGLVGRDLKANKVPEDFESEVRVALENVGIVLKEAGMTYDNVVTVNVYLTDVSLFQQMNKVYITFFKEPRPARTTVGVAKLAGDYRIEITVTARK